MAGKVAGHLFKRHGHVKVDGHGVHVFNAQLAALADVHGPKLDGELAKSERTHVREGKALQQVGLTPHTHPCLPRVHCLHSAAGEGGGTQPSAYQSD